MEDAFERWRRMKMGEKLEDRKKIWDIYSISYVWLPHAYTCIHILINKEARQKV